MLLLQLSEYESAESTINGLFSFFGYRLRLYMLEKIQNHSLLNLHHTTEKGRERRNNHELFFAFAVNQTLCSEDAKVTSIKTIIRHFN